MYYHHIVINKTFHILISTTAIQHALNC
jgi:hypothetical protein